ncbi:lysylphosphatidylglycerol synthase transmembrane domain-containing protein [Chitinimonas lacunae]|uniref:YbhN family protein n=1 Tax=Chitinimonas lacunae TaxID=1963018 RepID=A0ABV8MYJ5_9NEIS
MLSTAAPLSPRTLRTVLASVALAALGYLALSLWAGWREVLAAVQLAGIGLLFGIALTTLNFALRYLRWRCYLAGLGHRLPWGEGCLIYLAGFSLTTTPMKLGETLRGLLSLRHGVPLGQSLAIFVSERLLDLAIVLALVALGGSRFAIAQPALWLGFFLVGLMLLTLLRPAPLQRLTDMGAGAAQSWRRWLGRLAAMLLETRRCQQPVQLVVGLLLGTLAWTLEGWAFHSLLQTMGLLNDWPLALSIYMVAKLVGVLSMLPGGVGGTEAAMAMLLHLAGVPLPAAVAATLLIRLLTLWYAVAVGAASLGLYLGRTRP